MSGHPPMANISVLAFDDYLWLSDIIDLSFSDEEPLVRAAAVDVMSKETKIILQGHLAFLHVHLCQLNGCF